MFSRLLVCSDGSEHSLAAVRHAAALAVKFKSDVTLLSVFSPPAVVMPFTGGPDVMSVADTEAIQVVCDEYHQSVHESSGAELDRAGVPYSFRHELGDARDVIVDVAESIGADLVVIGSRGNGGLRRLLLGSVSDSVTHHVHCDVLVVR